MLNKILLAIVSLIFVLFVLFCLSWSSEAATPEQMEKIYKWAEVNKEKANGCGVLRDLGDVYLEQCQFRNTEEVDYATYNEHVLSVVVLRETSDNTIRTVYAIWIDLLEVTKLLHPGVSQTNQWNVGSYGHSGTADSINRMFRLYHPNAGIILPEWPKGFINPIWQNPPKEEAQKVYDTEINYWLNRIGK